MAAFEDLVDLNNSVAELLADETRPFNVRAASLLIKNTAAAAEILSPTVFRKLPAEVLDDALEMVSLANRIAPQTQEEKTLSVPRESFERERYRIGIWQPLYSLARTVDTATCNPNLESEELRNYRTAVHLGATVFAGIITKTSHHPTVNEIKGFFWSNSHDAAEQIYNLSGASVD